MTQNKLHITKAEINLLPMGHYNGPIQLINNPNDVPAAVEKLSKETLLGFDTETRPAFRVGESYLPSLIQLAGENEIYLFQIQQTGFTPELQNLLANPDIIKAGVAIKDDLSGLKKIAPFKPGGFIELADCAKRAKIKNLGLRGLGALLLGFRISKKAQVSNWARKVLQPIQVTYAATDAWIGREIYKKFDEQGLLGEG